MVEQLQLGKKEWRVSFIDATWLFSFMTQPADSEQVLQGPLQSKELSLLNYVIGLE